MKDQPSSLPQPVRILRTAEAAKKLSLGKTSFYELQKNDPTFPRAIVLGERARGYSERELDVWLASRPRA
jgi:predicted DNA-binding transcriptional regulator AlpA